MGLYLCKGQIKSIGTDGKETFITIEAITQFACKQNGLRKNNKPPSFDSTILNIFMEVNPHPAYQLTYTVKDPLTAFALPIDNQILVEKEFIDVLDLDTDPEYGWTFIIEEAKSPDIYKLKYIQLGPKEDDE